MAILSVGKISQVMKYKYRYQLVSILKTIIGTSSATCRKNGFFKPGNTLFASQHFNLH